MHLQIITTSVLITIQKDYDFNIKINHNPIFPNPKYYKIPEYEIKFLLKEIIWKPFEAFTTHERHNSLIKNNYLVLNISYHTNLSILKILWNTKIIIIHFSYKCKSKTQTQNHKEK